MESIKENQYDSTHHTQCLYIGWGERSIWKSLEKSGNFRIKNRVVDESGKLESQGISVDLEKSGKFRKFLEKKFTENIILAELEEAT